MIQIIKAGTVVATSRNLRGIRTYTAKVSAVIRVTIDRLPGNRARLIVVWHDGAACFTEFESFNVCVEWCLARRRFPGRLLGYTKSTPLDCTYRLDSSLEVTPRDQGAAVYRWENRKPPTYIGCVICGMHRASV